MGNFLHLLSGRKIIIFRAPNGTRTKADAANAGLSKKSRDFFECRPSCLAVDRSVSLVSNLPNKFCKDIFFEVTT